ASIAPTSPTRAKSSATCSAAASARRMTRPRAASRACTCCPMVSRSARASSATWFTCTASKDGTCAKRDTFATSAKVEVLLPHRSNTRVENTNWCGPRREDNLTQTCNSTLFERHLDETQDHRADGCRGRVWPGGQLHDHPRHRRTQQQRRRRRGKSRRPGGQAKNQLWDPAQGPAKVLRRKVLYEGGGTQEGAQDLGPAEGQAHQQAVERGPVRH